MKTTCETNDTAVAQEPTANGNHVTPRVDITETRDAYLLEADMPGVAKEGLEVLLDGGNLVITGHRTTVPAPGASLVRESRLTGYRRVFEIDPTIDTAHIKASMNSGVLTLRLPKTEAVKPRKISVE